MVLQFRYTDKDIQSPAVQLRGSTPASGKFQRAFEAQRGTRTKDNPQKNRLQTGQESESSDFSPLEFIIAPEGKLVKKRINNNKRAIFHISPLFNLLLYYQGRDWKLRRI